MCSGGALSCTVTGPCHVHEHQISAAQDLWACMHGFVLQCLLSAYLGQLGSRPQTQAFVSRYVTDLAMTTHNWLAIQVHMCTNACMHS